MSYLGEAGGGQGGKCVTWGRRKQRYIIMALENSA